MLENFKGGNFSYKRLTEEEQSKRGILGRLEGIIADTNGPTRNGRSYSLDLWQKVFNNDLVKESIKNRTCFCELGHPDDREDIDIEKVAACLAEEPKLGDDGNLYGVFDILPTPNGKILKALCDYGTVVGVSSRGTGDIYTDDNGYEAVDPDSYDFKCFDIVLTPAVESARMTYVNESLSKNRGNLKLALQESLKKSSDEDKKIMLDTLKELHINLEESNDTHSAKLDEQSDKTLCESKEKIVEEKKTDAIDDGTSELIKNLQEALKTNQDLKMQLKNLQESLAVSDAKVSTLNEDIARYKSVAARLGTVLRESKNKLKEDESIKEELVKYKSTIDELKESNRKLIEEKKTYVDNSTKLNESISKSDESVKKLNEALDNQKKQYESKLNSMNDEFRKKMDEAKRAVDRKSKIAETYKKLANSTVNKYIDSKALILGISSTEIKNKLSESFTLNDVDKVCDDIVGYNINMSKLPFNIGKCAKVEVKEAVEPLKKFTDSGVQTGDDDVDESLLRIAGLND